jgi:hypothetical protein
MEPGQHLTRRTQKWPASHRSRVGSPGGTVTYTSTPSPRRKNWFRHRKVLSTLPGIVLVLIVAGEVGTHITQNSASSGSSSTGSSNKYYAHGYSFVTQIANGGGDRDGYFASGTETASGFYTTMQLAVEPGPGQPNGANQPTDTGPAAHPGLPPTSSKDPNWQNDTTAWVNGCQASFNANGGG